MNKIYVFDLDGTLANIDHRTCFIEGKKKDWNSFYQASVDDKPNEWIVELFHMTRNSLGMHDRIVILTGRSQKYRELTTNWLCAYGIMPNNLIMRPEKDYTPDNELKPKLLELVLDGFMKEGLVYPRVAFIVEDRARVVNRWRELGYNVLQCSKGEY